MTDTDKKLARVYVSNWHKLGLIKTSVSVQLLSAASFLETIEDFILYAMKKVGISYNYLSKDYQNNTNFLVKAVLKLKDGLKLLTEIAESNKTMYLKVVDCLSEEEIAFVLKDVSLSKLPRTKLVARLKKEVTLNMNKEC